MDKVVWDTDFMVQLGQDKSKSEKYLEMLNQKDQAVELAHQSAHGYEGLKTADLDSYDTDKGEEKGL